MVIHHFKIKHLISIFREKFSGPPIPTMLSTHADRVALSHIPLPQIRRDNINLQITWTCKLSDIILHPSLICKTF